MGDKCCPKCGAEAVAQIEWSNLTTYEYECGREDTPYGFHEGEDCKDRQIAALTTEVHRLREVLGDIHTVAISAYGTEEQALKWIADRALQALEVQDG